MKKTFLILSAMFLIVMVCSCCTIPGNAIEGSGNVTSIKKNFDGFKKIKIANACKANIGSDKNYHVEIRIDDNIAKYLIAKKDGDTLKISLESGRHYRDMTFEANVTLPDLRGLNLSGASSARISGFSSGRDFRCKVSGASALYGKMNTGKAFFDLSGASSASGTMNTEDAEFELSGASHLTLRGEGKDIKIDASGASSLDLGDFVTGNCDVNLSGASRATVNMNGRLDGSMSGASKLSYYGTITLGDLSTSGASKLMRRD